jgi:hypothetical protein
MTSPIATPTEADSPAPTQSPAAQAHALRALADLLENTDAGELSVTFSADRISIQVPADAACPDTRAARVTLLAKATGGTARRETAPGPTRGWITADGLLAGHAVRIYTPIGEPS